MDAAELLDLLGNDTRRRILTLLAQKPCYVTELSDATGVSPKAVIEHLKRLEGAGLIEYTNGDDRRKYFTITNAQRLEITIAPHEFGTTNGYLPGTSIDNHRFSRLSIDLDVDGEARDPASLVRHLEELESLASELSRAQRCVHGELNRLYDRILEDLFEGAGGRLGIDIFHALDDGPRSVDDLSSRFSISRSMVRHCLGQLEEAGLVRRRHDGWVRTA
ncbi:MAG: ArsR family transcriptional regulator [Halobacteriota archaeon]